LHAIGSAFDAPLELPAERFRRYVQNVGCFAKGVPTEPERVLTLMELHWSEHGAALPVGARCCPDPCPALGVARARLEIHWFGITMLEIKESRRLETAASELSPDDPLRAEYVRKRKRTQHSLRFQGGGG
jgi:hypothetical protein